MVWSAVLLALSMTLAGCIGPSTTVRSTDRHVVPNPLTQIALEDFDVVSFLDVDLHTAIQTREAVESEFNAAYGQAGHPRWFFHAFDKKNLDFIVARFDPKDPSSPRYVAQRRLRVKRSREAELALGVTEVVREFEVGSHTVRAGMSRRDVSAALGRAAIEQPRGGAKGSYDLLYPALCVRFVDNRVANVMRRDQCAR
jgi:hypothetical protein